MMETSLLILFEKVKKILVCTRKCAMVLAWVIQGTRVEGGLLDPLKTWTTTLLCLSRQNVS